MRMLGQLGLPRCPGCRHEWMYAEHKERGGKSKRRRKKQVKLKEKRQWKEEQCS